MTHAARAPPRAPLLQGKKIGYDFLIMAPGIEIKLGAIKGLEDALVNHPNVSTNYLYQYAPKTFEMIKGFQEGDAMFTFPTGPVKCAGAPQKIMYLAVRAGLERTTSLARLLTSPHLAGGLLAPALRRARPRAGHLQHGTATHLRRRQVRGAAARGVRAARHQRQLLHGPGRDPPGSARGGVPHGGGRQA